MKTEDYSKSIIAAKFFPIEVEWRGERVDFKGDVFCGTLDSFFSAAKALEAKAIFLAAKSLKADDFKYTSDFSDDLQSDDDYDDEEEQQLYEVDLVVAQPALVEFKQYLGVDHTFLLTAKGGYSEISYFQSEKWLADFIKEKQVAISKAHENIKVIHKEMQQQQEARDAELEKLVKNLINDQEFVLIPTQRGMISYALEKYPQLDGMDGEYLKILIQNLNDKIRTKRLNKRNK